jgi:ATP-dependent RNA helicase DHX8/PRP22
LASVVLQLKALGINDVQKFDFMDPPPPAGIKKAIELLTTLGALDKDGQLTPTGKTMAALPLDPMLSKSLIMAQEFECTEEILCIVSMMSGESVFFLPRGNKRKSAEDAHKRFHAIQGDHITMLNVFREYLNAKNKKQWCAQNFINSRAIQHIKEIWRQLLDYCGQLGIRRVSAGNSNIEAVLRCLVSGFFIKAAVRQQDGLYKTLVGNKIVRIHPSSVLFSRRPICVLYNHLVFTKQKYMRDVVVIDQHWLAELAPHFYARKTNAQIHHHQSLPHQNAALISTNTPTAKSNTNLFTANQPGKKK